MTPAEFKAARHTLGLSVGEAADVLAIDPRTLRRWEDDRAERPPHPTAARVMQWLLDGFRPPEWPGGEDEEGDDE